MLFLLKYLSENKTITLKEFINKAEINKKEAEKILINFTLINITKIDITEKETIFSLYEDENENTQNKTMQ